MNRFTKSTTQWLLIILFFSNVLSTIAQPQIIEAKIEDRRSNQLEVTFSESVRLNNANGFRLVGGVARIKALINGSGSNRLTFSLTDHVLPDDQFSLLHWPELSDAFASSGKLPAFNDVPVDNQASSYRGNGNLFFVANNGSDASSGRNPSSPLRSIDKALSLARPGDYILLKRGDSWPQFAVRNTNGQSGKPITIAAYGSGNKPRIRVNRGNGISIIDSDFITLDNLHVRMESSRKRGVYFTGNTSNPVISNSLVECISSMGFYGIDFGDKDGSRVTNPTVLNNVVRKFRWNIRSSGFPYDGTHNVYGGLIENNISAGNFNAPDARDGISAQRGNFHGLIIRKNEVFGWVDDAMDFYASDNIIVEYNTIHDPLNFSSKASGSGSGNALKVGGTTSSADRVGGKSSTNIVVRYNQVYNVKNNLNSRANLNAIVTNGGASGEIYGNLIFNIGGAGIKVDGSPKDWKIFNNTVYDTDKGFNAYTTGGNPSNVRLENNILHGRRGSITANTFGRGNVRGEKNLFLSGQAKGDYAGSNDISSTADKVFASTRDLTLRDNAPAVDNGISINAYKKDRRGFAINNRTDIGAHELSDDVPMQNPEPQPEANIQSSKTQKSITFRVAGASSTKVESDTFLGWGDALPQLLSSETEVINYAIPGTSTRSFIDRGFWDKLISETKPGDFVVIIFGHNDQKKDQRYTSPGSFPTYQGTYKTTLMQMAKDVFKKHATPILCSPVERAKWKNDGSLAYTHDNYVGAAAKAAKEVGALFFDMNFFSRIWMIDAGEENMKMHFPMYPKDITHTGPEGALKNAQSFILELERKKPGLKKYVLLEGG